MGESPGTVMFLASKLNSGMLYQAAPSGGNISMMKTFGLIFLFHRDSSILKGLASTEGAIAVAAKSLVKARKERIVSREKCLRNSRSQRAIG